MRPIRGAGGGADGEVAATASAGPAAATKEAATKAAARRTAGLTRIGIPVPVARNRSE